MNSDILAGLDFFEREKGIKRDVLLEAINTAVLTAARKAVTVHNWSPLPGTKKSGFGTHLAEAGIGVDGNYGTAGEASRRESGGAPSGAVRLPIKAQS